MKIKIIKRLIIGILLISIFFIGVTFTIYYFRFNITFFDNPSKLSGKIETIQVTYVNWASDCPDFIET